MSEQKSIEQLLVDSQRYVSQLESQLSTLSSNYTAICDKYDTVRGELDRVTHSRDKYKLLTEQNLETLALSLNQREALDAELAATNEQVQAFYLACVHLDKAIPVFGRDNPERIRFAADEILRMRAELAAVRDTNLALRMKMAEVIRERDTANRELAAVREGLPRVCEQHSGAQRELDCIVCELLATRHERNQLRRERDRLREAVGWRPIETADTLPKDGSHFLLIDMLNHGIPVVAVYFDYDFMECNDGTWIEVESYTHWKRLEPPTQPQPENSL